MEESRANMQANQVNQVNQEAQTNQKKNGRWKLFAILTVCAAPLIASYITYYVIKPEGRTNYGAILDPRQFPQPASLTVVHTEQAEQEEQAEQAPQVQQAPQTQPTPEEKKVTLADLKGKWLMVQVDSGACATACQKKQYDMRQLRTAQGKESDRIERVWLTTDDVAVDPKLLVGIEGTHIIKADLGILEKWLPVDAGTTIQEHIYLIDPLGNLMMRYPKEADANKIKKDLSKLLKASAIG